MSAATEIVLAFCANDEDEWHVVSDDRPIYAAWRDDERPLGGQCRSCGTPDDYCIVRKRGTVQVDDPAAQARQDHSEHAHLLFAVSCLACGAHYDISEMRSGEVVF